MHGRLHALQQRTAAPTDHRQRCAVTLAQRQGAKLDAQHDTRHRIEADVEAARISHQPAPQRLQTCFLARPASQQQRCIEPASAQRSVFSRTQHRVGQRRVDRAPGFDIDPEFGIDRDREQPARPTVTEVETQVRIDEHRLAVAAATETQRLRRPTEVGAQNAPRPPMRGHIAVTISTMHETLRPSVLGLAEQRVVVSRRQLELPDVNVAGAHRRASPSRRSVAPLQLLHVHASQAEVIESRAI